LAAATVKIGRPGYRVTKQYDPASRQRSLLFQVEYPEIEDGGRPRHRFMSAYEQRQETADKAVQYLLFAAEPYETVAFKVPNIEVIKQEDYFYSHWWVVGVSVSVCVYVYLVARE
jgi:splicing factor 3A subunit 2